LRSLIKIISPVLKISSYIITKITAGPIGLAAILAIVSVSTIKTADKYGITADMKDEKDIITRIAACSRPSKLTLYTIIAF
jgi:hypothetical protein